MNSIVSLKNVTFKYEQDVILNHVNLEVLKQNYIAIIGDNGAGKSTLLKLLIGQLVVQEGEVTLFNQEIKDVIYTGKVGYVAQISLTQSFNFPATVLEIVKYSLYPSIKRFRFPSKAQTKKALEVLDKVGLLDKKDALFTTLSGGQQQRVMLAKALVNDPKLLILDEPTSGVDHKTSEQFYEMLKELNQQGLTIILVTHNIDHLSKDVTHIYKIENQHLTEVQHHEHS